MHDLITIREAGEILSRTSGKPVSTAYVRVLVQKGRLHPTKVDGRTNMFSREEVEKITIGERGRPKKRLTS